MNDGQKKYWCIILIMGLFFVMAIITGCSFFKKATEQGSKQAMYNNLSPEEENIIINKGTEAPFTGKFLNHKADGVYTCKQCGAELYRSDSKFDSGCGWPSFDDEIEGAVKHVPDADGIRTEIVCANCGGHLGHIFLGEGHTPKNTRHCVNSLSIDFKDESADESEITANVESSQEKAIFASGCFWGTEYHFKKVDGVISTTVGYIGGHVDKPTYGDVCTDATGHAEAVEIIFDPSKTSYEELAKLYFETHDFTQVNRQGPDIGEQYRSEIFYINDGQKKIAEKLIGILEKKGYKVATKLSLATEFFAAEDYHQDYYEKNGKTPYCHVYEKIF